VWRRSSWLGHSSRILEFRERYRPPRPCGAPDFELNPGREPWAPMSPRVTISWLSEHPARAIEAVGNAWWPTRRPRFGQSGGGHLTTYQLTQFGKGLGIPMHASE
jgi:hypothetical protein